MPVLGPDTLCKCCTSGERTFKTSVCNEVTLEMLKRINGNWKSTSEENIIQEKFWKMFDYEFIKSPTFRVGSSFLKKNMELFN